MKEGSMVFVIAKKGTLLYDEPNTKTTSIGTLVHGMSVQLMTVKNDFAIVNAYIHRTSVKNGKTLESYIWENVYTPITNLGNRDELQILEELVYQSLENDNTSEFSKITAISALKKYLTIQIVSEKDFNEALKNKSSDWIDDKPRFKKETKNS